MVKASRASVLSLLLFVGTVAAAERAVEGVVVDAASGVGIAGASVSCSEMRREGSVIAPAVGAGGGCAGAVSDANGKFTLTFAGDGSFSIRAELDGYGPEGPAMDFYSLGTFVSVGPEYVAPRSLRIVMARESSVRGTVQHPKTKAPVAEFDVDVYYRSRQIALDTEIPFARAKQRAGGVFEVSRLSPGPLRFRIRPGVKDVALLKKDGVSIDWFEGLPPSVEGPCPSWWDVADRKDDGRSLWVGNGEVRDLGAVWMRQCHKQVAMFAILADQCRADAAPLAVTLADQQGLSRVTGEVRCGRSFAFLNVPDGTYELLVDDRGVGGVRSRAYHSFQVVGKSYRATLDLRPDRTLCGDVRMESDEDALPAGMTVSARPQFGNVLANERDAEVGKDGRFCKEAIGPMLHKVALFNVPKGYFVSRIEGTTLGASMRVVVGKGSASLALVDKSAVAAVRRRAFLVRWPATVDTLRQRMTASCCDMSDTKEFWGIAPGEYRVALLDADKTADLNAAQLLAILQAGKSVVLGRSEAKRIDVEP